MEGIVKVREEKAEDKGKGEKVGTPAPLPSPSSAPAEAATSTTVDAVEDVKLNPIPYAQFEKEIAEIRNQPLDKKIEAFLALTPLTPYSPSEKSFITFENDRTTEYNTWLKTVQTVLKENRALTPSKLYEKIDKIEPSNPGVVHPMVAGTVHLKGTEGNKTIGFTDAQILLRKGVFDALDHELFRAWSDSLHPEKKK